MMSGSVESFRHELGFSTPESSPDAVTVALWMEFKGNDAKGFEFLVGGPKLNVEFEMKQFHGLDEKNCAANTKVILTEELSNIQFKRGSNTQNWDLFHHKYADKMSIPGATVDFTEGPSIYTR